MTPEQRAEIATLRTALHDTDELPPVDVANYLAMTDEELLEVLEAERLEGRKRALRHAFLDLDLFPDVDGRQHKATLGPRTLRS